MFQLHLADQSGDIRVALYQPLLSELIWEDTGKTVVTMTGEENWPDAIAVSPEVPGTKSKTPRRLKIQLGLSCNFSCSYCNQSSEIHKASITKLDDVEPFLASLRENIEGEPDRVELWGGEPFVYVAKLEKLLPGLRELYPNTQFTTITNGSLFTDRVFALIDEYDIALSISHDGPGQGLRGPDPLKDDKQRASIHKLVTSRPGMVGFSAVLTQGNCNPVAIHQHIADALGLSVDAFSMDFEGIVQAYDDRVAAWQPEQYADMKSEIFNAFIEKPDYGAFMSKLKTFITLLQSGMPASVLGQKCGMDKDSNLAVDLAGQVMTCQNTGAKGEHHIGQLDNLPGVQLNTSWHWSNRERCRQCPVVALCAGSCMFLSGDNFDVSCENEYHYNLAILAGILAMVTGRVLVGLEGDHPRPEFKNNQIPVLMV